MLSTAAPTQERERHRFSDKARLNDCFASWLALSVVRRWSAVGVLCHPLFVRSFVRITLPNYLSHHLAGIVTAAVFSDAAHIVEEIALLKTRTRRGATRTAAAANPFE